MDSNTRDALKKLKSARKSLDRTILLLETVAEQKVQGRDLESAARLAAGWVKEEQEGKPDPDEAPDPYRDDSAGYVM